MTASYGPHREADHPQTVTIRGPHKQPRDEEVPVPAVIRRQRAALNSEAHAAVPPTHAIRDGRAACGAPAPWQAHVVLPTEELTRRRFADGTIDCPDCHAKVAAHLGLPSPGPAHDI